MSSPDVTVVLAVYNTMPYLSTCLASLASQSIGRDRMQVIAVDDGSTDGSGRELDRFARLHPGLVTVIHQANSGGPALPCNRGLERATGRYVFFLGADDYLGTDALRRLVDAADTLDSDVVLGKLVGVNSRHIHQEVFAGNESDISLFDSALPYALSNTKLFRRELIERHALRYPEHMPVGSDQPFTLAACLRARRISVLADYDFYYAVRRLNTSNITYSSRHERRLRFVEEMMRYVAELIEPGPRRDAILIRHFRWELARLVEDSFLRLDPTEQELVMAGVGKLVEQYLTDSIRDRLDVATRLRLGVSERGELADLIAVIRQDAERGVAPSIIDNGRWYAGYPGFRDPRLALPDHWFDVTDRLTDWLARLDTTSVSLRGGSDGARVLIITARSPRPDLAQLSPAIRLRAGEVDAEATLTGQSAGTVVRAEFSLPRLLAASAATGTRFIVRTHVDGDPAGSAHLRAPQRLAAARAVLRRGIRPYLVTIATDHRGYLVIAVAPVTAGRVLARLRRGLLQGGH